MRDIQKNLVIAQRGNRELCMTVRYSSPFNHSKGKLILPGYKGKVKYAQFLNDSSELLYKPLGNDDMELTLPAKKPDYEIPMVELTLQ